MSGIIFDLDGTLIDSAPDIHACAQAVMAEEGFPELTLAQVRSFIGKGVPALLSQCLGAHGIEQTPALSARMLARFQAQYETAVNLTVLYPGVRAALEALHADGFRLGLCTNKPQAPTHAVLRHFGLDHLFCAFAFGDGPYARKPDPAPLRHVIDQIPARHFLYVGDSETDCATARNAGIRMALHTEGYRKTPVEQLYHDVIFSHFDQLRGIAERLAPLPE